MNETLTKAVDQVRSKILRLEFGDRMKFNRMVRDCLLGQVLIAWLNDHGVPGVTAKNLSKYKRSPAYKRWLEDEKTVDADCEKGEQAKRLAEKMGGSASEHLKAMLAGKLYTLLGSATAEDLNRLVPGVRAVIEAERFQFDKRRAVELAMQICADTKAREIVDNPDLTADKKTDLLGKQLFGEDW